MTGTSAPPPLAAIETQDGIVAGILGSYAIDGSGSDAPWQPFDALPRVSIAQGATIAVRFGDGATIGQASVVIATADDTAGLAPQSVPSASIGGQGPALTVGPLPAGRWVLAVRLFRADGRGDGVTYWAITVP